MIILDIVIIAVINLFVLKFVIGQQRFVEFDSYYYYFSTSRPSISILPVNVKYEVILTAGCFATKTGNSVIKNNQEQTSAEVNCPFFMSFNYQGEGIYTCQDNNEEYYLISSARIEHNWIPKYFGWRVTCDDLFADIIEGEEIQIPCNMRLLADSNFRIEGEVTIGWIQGQRNITQSFHLKISGKSISFIQKFIGFTPGEGLFFYCINLGMRLRCYTLVLIVLPNLQVKIKPLYEFSENDYKHCYKCIATGGSNNKIFNWNLNGLQLKSNNDPEICLTNLTAGSYNVECLVSTNTQKSSDVIEFTVKDVIPTNTGTPLQDNQLWLKYISANENKNRYKIIVIILTVITIILVFVVFILGYILIRKRNNNDPQKLIFNQRSDVNRTSGVSQADEDDEVYHTIGEPSAVATDNEYVENFTKSSDADEEVCNGRVEETPQYFVLAS